MNKLLRASVIVSGLSLVLFLGISIQPVAAQTTPDFKTLCKDNQKCLSFDPAVNPMLNGYTVNKTGDSRGAPTTQPDGSTCVLYNPPSAFGTPESGCLKGSVFTLNGTLSSGEVLIDTQTGSDGTQSADPNPASTGQSDNCNLDFLCTISKLPGMLFAALGFLLLNLSAFILGIAGTVFNWVVIRTVFQFALYFGTSAGMLVAWGVLRDIANIALLFGFIFVGIATILNTQSVEGYTAKKALPRLIIFAVLLNFSLFATQAIIDVANGFSSVFATYAGQEQCDQGVSSKGNDGQSQTDCANIGISSKILEAAGMHQLFPKDWSGLQQAWGAPYTYTVMLIMLSLMVTVTAMVLIAATIMLVVRVVVLSLLMVTSPIGFAGMAIPSLQKIAQDWWHKLINQAFFAPLFLLMIFVSLKLVEGLQSGEATIADAILGNTGAGGNTTAGNMQVVMVFMIVIGFMIGALMIAQKMGAYGASFATKTAGGIAFGAQGFVARRTVGRVSGKIASKLRGTKFAEGNLGRLVVSAADAGSKASYSSRNLAGGVLKGAGVDIGKANKTAGHGYHGIEEKAEKVRLDYAKTLQNRTENDEEYAARQPALKRAHEQNAHDLSEAEAAIPAAEDARAAAQQHLATREFALREQRAVLAQNPADARAQQALLEEERNVARANEELAQADKNLADATKALANAKEARSKLIKDSERITIKGSDRQKAFARNIEHEGDLDFMGIKGVRVTAASHGNHAAAAKILNDLNKDEAAQIASKIEKLMREKAKSEGSDTEHKDETPKATTRGGGGGAPTH